MLLQNIIKTSTPVQSRLSFKYLVSIQLLPESSKMSSDVNRRFKLALYGSQVSYDELTNNINAIRSSLAVTGHKLSTMDIISKAVEKFLSSDKPDFQYHA